MPNYPGGLDDHLKDVSASSPDDIHDDDLELEEDELESDAAAKDSDDDPGQDTDDDDGKSGRSIENIYREFARKQNEFQERMQRQYTESIQMLVSELRAQPAPPVQQDGNSLDATSVEDLKAMRANVPEDKREAFDDYLMERIIKQETGKFAENFTKTQEFELARRDANRLAVERYRELRDRNSDFYRQVDAELRARGTTYAQTNPRAVLEVANEVAAATGKMPGRPVADFTRQKGQQRSAKPVKSKSEDTLSDEKAQAIKERLEASIPGISIDIERVKENHKIYSENKDLFVK